MKNPFRAPNLLEKVRISKKETQVSLHDAQVSLLRWQAKVKELEAVLGFLSEKETALLQEPAVQTAPPPPPRPLTGVHHATLSAPPKQP